MKSIIRVLKSIYDFFAGDAILLVAVALAFGLAAFLSRATHEENLLVVAAFVGLIIIGLITTVGRELGSANPPKTNNREKTTK